MANEEHETIADIAAAMRDYSNACNDGYLTEYSVVCTDMRNYADRIEAASERERGEAFNRGVRAKEKLMNLILRKPGNAAKLREALEKCANMGEQIDCQLGSSDETVYAFRDERCLAHNISECARSALSAPPRNCDVGTADEQTDRFKDLCRKYRRGPGPRANCKGCPIQHESLHVGCTFAWSQMPYEEGGAE